jgi:hypothetical protein
MGKILGGSGSDQRGRADCTKQCPLRRGSGFNRSGRKASHDVRFPKEPIGRIAKALNVMMLHVTGKNLFGPPLPDSELGYRIAEEIDRCILCLKEVQNTPRMDTGLEAMLKVGTHGLDSLLQEFGRLMILRQCELCRRVMFPSSDRKRFCSDESEGRDCGHRAANKSSYERSRATKGRMTPKESAKRAAKAKWAKRPAPGKR